MRIYYKPYMPILHIPLKGILEFTKLVGIVEIKGNKILCNIKTWWIFMLSLTQKMMVEYKALLVKMAMDQNTN